MKGGNGVNWDGVKLCYSLVACSVRLILSACKVASTDGKRASKRFHEKGKVGKPPARDLSNFGLQLLTHLRLCIILVDMYGENEIINGYFIWKATSLLKRLFQ